MSTETWPSIWLCKVVKAEVGLIFYIPGKPERPSVCKLQKDARNYDDFIISSYPLTIFDQLRVTSLRLTVLPIQTANTKFLCQWRMGHWYVWSSFGVASLTFELSASCSNYVNYSTYSSLPELDADRQTAAECCLIAEPRCNTGEIALQLMFCTVLPITLVCWVGRDNCVQLVKIQVGVIVFRTLSLPAAAAAAVCCFV